LVDAHFYLARALEAKRDWDAATAEYQSVTRLRPNDVRAYLRLGSVYEQTGQMSDSVSVYEDGRRIAPDNVEVRVALGLALKATGQYAAAREELAAALRLLPERPGQEERRKQLQQAMYEAATKSSREEGASKGGQK
jgi:tetratricopeptide (TPR) repeat protein